MSDRQSSFITVSFEWEEEYDVDVDDEHRVNVVRNAWGARSTNAIHKCKTDVAIIMTLEEEAGVVVVVFINHIKRR